MPLPCKNPRYRWKNGVRLGFCGNKVVETKKKGGKARRRKRSRPGHPSSK